ncbi:MFS transporter [Fictibacillus enclensis]|uniref:MFS transporter n=1 Tax=Fictibacillus enclensis TaxID=1017270 RepID=UPI0025A0EB23|nr:MFS transporter [Fictibacillus enclensis]MDM5198068.1 MFS transporter [Fictibacillus enclensis]
MKTPFYFYWFASTSISLADVIYIMVITTFIYQQTGSAFQASLFPLLKALANFAAGFTAPLLLEKAAYSKLLVSLQLLKAALLTGLTFNFSFFTSSISFLLIFVLFISFIEGWGSPILSSVVPKLIEKENLVKANSLLSVTSQTVQIAGYTFTGFIVVKMGHMPTLIGAVILLWLATISLGFTSGSIKTERQQKKVQSKWATLKEGWSLLWHNQTLRLVTIMDLIEGVAGTIWVGALTLVYVKEVLNQEAQWWGYINSSYYVGTILGGFFTFWLARKIQNHLVINIAIGSSVFALFTLFYGLSSTPILSLVLCVLMGIAYQLRDVSQQTVIQTNVDNQILPKVYASRSIILSTVTGSSIALFGFIADFLGIRWVYILGACLIASSAFLSFTLVKFQKAPKTGRDDLSVL